MNLLFLNEASLIALVSSVAAKFRAKRKHHVGEVSRRISDLEISHDELTKQVGELKRENLFLRVSWIKRIQSKRTDHWMDQDMVQLKYGFDVDKSLDKR